MPRHRTPVSRRKVPKPNHALQKEPAGGNKVSILAPSANVGSDGDSDGNSLDGDAGGTREQRPNLDLQPSSRLAFETYSSAR